MDPKGLIQNRQKQIVGLEFLIQNGQRRIVAVMVGPVHCFRGLGAPPAPSEADDGERKHEGDDVLRLAVPLAMSLPALSAAMPLW